MDLKEQINSSEQKYRKILEDFLTEIFPGTGLLSHGIDHHKRVWIYAKKILDLLEKRDLISDISLPEKLIISCYLHDSGMSADTGLRHGKHSRHFCEEFLLKQNLPLFLFEDVLSAIENHDNKDYSVYYHPTDLITILSVADDLDAFGFIGIYRYLEIYLTRGISPEESGFLIIKNAEKRFDNFLRMYSFMDLFAEEQKKRYEILNSFFNEYNRNISAYKLAGKNPSGYCGVAEIIQYMLQNNLKMNDIYFYVKNYYSDPVIMTYFDSLARELNESDTHNF
jgi:HD superfamily phosphodiesterase